MPLRTWLSFALLSLTFCLIPGPSVCFTIAYALKYGRSHALASIAGQLSANALYILAVAVGLSGPLVDSSGILAALKLGGIAYLAYLGVMQWRAKPAGPEYSVREDAGVRGAWKGFGRGFLVCGTNPKTVIYYAAILPPFISSAGSRSLQLAILSATTVLAGGSALVLYALFAAKVRERLMTPGASRIRNRVAGGLMLAAALYLAVLQRSRW